MRSLRRNMTRIALLAVIGLCVGLAGCSRSSTPGGSSSSRAEKGRKDAEALAIEVATVGATAQAKLLEEEKAKSSTRHALVRSSPKPRTLPRTGRTPVVHERVVSSVPYTSEAEADADAITRACELVSQKLASLDPPVHYTPSAGEVKAEFIRKDSRTVRPPDAEEKKVLADYGVERNVVYVEYDVEVSADQVRELRSQERVSFGLRVMGGLFALALAGFLFLRADEWTKGYLTHWLALGAVMLAGAAAAFLIFV